MIVYSKTNTGRLRAFEQKPSLSLALRDLLRRVDGKTHHLQLMTQPTDTALLDELLRRQLVQIAPEPWRSSSAFSQAPEQSSEQAANVQDSGGRLRLVADAAGLRTAQVRSNLEAAKALMCEFIQVVQPLHTQATINEITAIASEAQLLCMLDGYIHLVNQNGQAGQKHVQAVLLALAGGD